MDKNALIQAFQDIAKQLAGIDHQLASIAGKTDWSWLAWLAIIVLTIAIGWFAWAQRRSLAQIQSSQRLSEESVRIALQALDQQVRQSKTELWRTLCQEWHHEMLLDRKFFATYWKDMRMLKVRYAKVMNFFETLGYLVNLGVVDNDLCKQSFWQYFSAYFEAAQPLMQDDRHLNAALFKHVYDLRDRWGADPVMAREQGIVGFMSEESILTK